MPAVPDGVEIIGPASNVSGNMPKCLGIHLGVQGAYVGVEGCEVELPCVFLALGAHGCAPGWGMWLCDEPTVQVT